MYSYGPPHLAKQKQDDQLEHTYSSYVRIRDVALKTCHEGRIYYKSDVTFVLAYYYYVRAPLPLKIMAFTYMMMAQSRAESTRDTYNYGQYINQCPPPEYDKSNSGIRTDPEENM